MQKLNAAQWSKYWQNETLTTFHNIFTENYDGNIKEFWYSIFELLSDNANIVDFATGNGAISFLAADFSQERNKDFNITGIDYAKINPKSDIHSSVNFIGETSIEQTGLDPKQIDLITSQYGIEYSDTGKSILEAQRLLKDQGILALLVHRTDSVLLQEAFEAKKQIELCRQTHLIKITLELLKELEKPSKKSEKLRNKFNTRLAKLYENVEHFRDPNYLYLFTKTLTGLFESESNEVLSSIQKKQILNDLKAETLHYEQRMQDLISAALDAKKLEHMLEEIKKAGFQLKTSAPLFYKNQLFGHCIVAIK